MKHKLHYTELCALSIMCVCVSSIGALETKCCPDGECFEIKGPFAHLPAPECGFTINYRLSTRNVNNVPMTHQHIPGEFQPTKRTIFISHGFTGDIRTKWLHKMKDAFITKDDVNVVLVGWGAGATWQVNPTINYYQAASNTRVVGADIANITHRLQAKGLARSDTWCVGFSLGSHVCGFAGKKNRWGKVTGLDPAGPKFRDSSTAARLHKTDGYYVDVIHTIGKGGFLNKLPLGLMTPLGHADFYPNGAKRQPGCPIPGTARRRRHAPAARRHRYRRFEATIACSHARAHMLYIESINSDCFNVSKKCSSETDMPNSCSDCGKGCQLMGYGSKSTAPGLYYLTTNKASPFCKQYTPSPRVVSSHAATWNSTQITFLVFCLSTLITLTLSMD